MSPTQTSEANIQDKGQEPIESPKKILSHVSSASQFMAPAFPKHPLFKKPPKQFKFPSK